MTPLLEEINRESGGAYDNFRLCSMKYVRDTNTCQIYFHYRYKEGQEYRGIERVAAKILPSAVKYSYSYARVVDHIEDVVLFVRNFMHREYRIELEENDVDARFYAVVLRLKSMEFHHCNDIGACDSLATALDEEFCMPFSVSTQEIREERDATEIARTLYEGILNAAPSEETTKQKRVIEPFNIEKYIGDIVEGPAKYISDAKPDPDERVTFCGKFSNANLRELPSKKDPAKIVRIFRFTLTDFTGSINCFCFVSESNLNKFAELEPSAPIIVNGVVDHGYQNSGLEFKVSRISYCELPEEFQEVVYKKETPDRYLVVFPREYVMTRQANLFDDPGGQVNPFFLGKRFVVFDTETTGINISNDRIVEIACVKIIDGVIREYLHTMVNPKIHIPEGASKVNHITDDMVADAPFWEDVVGDVYRFCEGCTLVGHNVTFDMNMLNNTARQTHYYFENTTMDTLQIAQKKVRDARNYTLGNLLKVFGLVNDNAHRALEDTVATAHLFMKLIEL